MADKFIQKLNDSKPIEELIADKNHFLRLIRDEIIKIRNMPNHKGKQFKLDNLMRYEHKEMTEIANLELKKKN